jgi:hypothetical protein
MQKVCNIMLFYVFSCSSEVSLMSSLTSIFVANLLQLEAISAPKMYVKTVFVANSLHLAVIHRASTYVIVTVGSR